MKRILTFCLSAITLSCSQEAKQTSQTSASSIEGAWELTENRVDGKLIMPKRSQQIKLFHDGFFSFMMYNEDGSFHGSGAGTYQLQGNKYIETFSHYSDTTWVGYADQQEWELRGDTLIFSGFKKVFDPKGNEMAPETWGGDKFVEKRVRMKK